MNLNMMKSYKSNINQEYSLSKILIMDIPSFKYNGKTNVWGNDKITFYYFCCKSEAEILMVIDNAGNTL